VRGAVCGGCVDDLPRRQFPRLKRKFDAIDAAFAAFHYEFPITDLVKSAKFQADLGALSVLFSGFSEDFLRELKDVDVIVPVPMLPWRFLRRGFNQAEELAQVLSRLTPYPVGHGLVSRRHLWGQAQSRLNADARRENMVDAFKVHGAFADRRIVIVDDVITTGATTSALAGALRVAGATRIIVVAAAATRLNKNISNS
jgi:ComF family protein